MDAPKKPWIVSSRFDLLILAIPFLASLAALPTLATESRDVPLWAFLILIVAFDVAHVWATVYVTYLETARNRYLFDLQDKRSVHDFDFILARIEADYRSQASLGDEIDVELWPTRIGAKSWVPTRSAAARIGSRSYAPLRAQS